MPQRQLDDLPVAWLQPGEGGADEPAHFGTLGGAGIGGPFVRDGYVTEGLSRHAQPPVALVTSHRVKPGPQLAGIAEGIELAAGDDERDLQGIGRHGRFAQHPLAVAVKGRRVLVVRSSQPSRVACHDRPDHLTVVHGTHGS